MVKKVTKKTTAKATKNNANSNSKSAKSPKTQHSKVQAKKASNKKAEKKTATVVATDSSSARKAKKSSSAVSSQSNGKKVAKRLGSNSGNNNSKGGSNNSTSNNISANNINNNNNKKNSKTDDKAADSPNIVTLIEKGGAAVDHEVLHAKDYYVLPDLNNEYNGKHFCATLNLSDLKNNNNKFYLIQILVNTNTKDYWFWNRWGRVGYQGQSSFSKCSSLELAKKTFLSKYREKTGKGYENIQIDYANEEENKRAENKGKEKDVKKAKNEDAKAKAQKKLAFDEQVKTLLNLIYDLKLMNQQMKEIGYDANKMPLGKLSQQMIKDGYEVLREIENVLKGTKKADLYELSSRFYTIIPHNFGYQKMANFVIDSVKKLKEKLEMIDSLSEIEIATKILAECDEDQDEIDTLNSHYKKLNCEIKSVDSTTETFSYLKTYLKNTTSDNSYYNIEIEEAYELCRNGEPEKFKENIGNKKLLWHGSRITNFVGILSQGLRIAPPEAPCSGYLFGKGVYFADMASKSVGYCCPTNNTALILLCEVALGNMNEKLNTDYNAASLPKGKHSTKGCGVTHPDPNKTVVVDGVEIPLGNPVKSKNNTYLGYNEYIVYDTDQVKLRYLLRLRMK